MPRWGWLLIAGLAVLMIVLMWRILVLGAAVVVVLGILALATGRSSWLLVRSRRAAGTVTAAAAAFVLVAGGIGAAASSGAPAPTSTAIVAGSTASVPPTMKSEPTATSTPTRTPVTVLREETVTAPIPFEKISIEDGTIPRGESRITTAGSDGEKTSVFRITTVDGVETARDLVSESVTREPVREVTSAGTYVAPPPAEAPSSSDGCHPSYADACVPIDSDVDCAGGKGNGPSYFSGVARVVGPDVYDLDRDGDGWACQS
ncbi:G5 domain-containing protein [Microbacterium sp. RURRCA19A]|nr:G5 domain-containing protein [Microbacterium sp. RURRCA19A]